MFTNDDIRSIMCGDHLSFSIDGKECYDPDKVWSKRPYKITKISYSGSDVKGNEYIGGYMEIEENLLTISFSIKANDKSDEKLYRWFPTVSSKYATKGE